MRIIHMATTSPYTRFGQKGLGEGGAIAPPAAITNAVNDALKGLGVELLVSPVTLRAGGGGDQGGRHGLNYGSLSTTYDRV
jgi:CO/xanthine dehydrogenase Mo-binding subunit